MTVRFRLFAALGALGALALVLVALLLAAGQRSASDLAKLEHDLATLSRLKIVADKYAVDIVDASHKARNGNQDFAASLATVETGHRTLKAEWVKFKSGDSVAHLAPIIARVDETMMPADAATAELKQILTRGDALALDRFVKTRLYQTIDPVSGAISDLVVAELKVGSDLVAASQAWSNRLLWASAVLALVALGVAAAAMLIVRSRVIAPIVGLGEAMRRLAADETGVVIPHVEGTDEIGDMARSADAFRRAAEDRRRIEAQRAEERQREARDNEEVVTALKSALAELVGGNLTATIDTYLPERFKAIRMDFNAVLSSLAQMIGAIQHSVASIRTGTSEISVASDDLARRTERQAATLEESAAALDRTTGTVRQTAANAKAAAERVASANRAAEDGMAVARRAADAMDEIEQSSAKIGAIVSVIDEIAYQTNILALNANVEAARAGDAGRGFAVVANEVRSLAQRSSAAAKEIKELIAASGNHVAAGVALSGQSSAALQRIAEEVVTINALFREIASAAEEQSAQLATVTTAIGQMDRATQENAAMVEESTAAARSLAGEADELADLVRKFHTSDGAEVLAAAATRAPPPRPKLAAVARGRAAPAAMSDAGDWSRF